MKKLLARLLTGYNLQYTNKFNAETNKEYFFKFEIVEYDEENYFGVWVGESSFSSAVNILESVKIYEEKDLFEPCRTADENFACEKLPIGTYYLVVSFNTPM